MFQSLSRRSRSLLCLASSMFLVIPAGTASAQDDDDQIEEITVTGSQIKGVPISGALPVSVVSVEDIEAFGIDSGDELLDFIPENGNNFFNEAENISGGVNSARGDIGAFNLRSLGTGNTLVLLNGRRLVMAPQYQTEEIGGSFVPVNTVNSNTIPVFGVQRVEVLREGASAIYGADAVAGVVNTVLKDDLDGFSIRAKYNDYDNVDRNDVNLTFEWGNDFNGGATNVGVFFNWYDRDNVAAAEDERWADSDFRRRLPEDSPWADTTLFRNDSANSLYGQYDFRASMRDDPYNFVAAGVVDPPRPGRTVSDGEFETYPAGDSRCSYDLAPGVCGAPDGQGTYRYNLNEFRDINSELERTSVFLYINHEMENGVESFTELSAYEYESTLSRHPSASFSSVKLRVPAENHWNPFGPIGAVNRLPDTINGVPIFIPDEGLELEIDNYRFAEVPRIVDNDGDSYRILQGFRGTAGDWDWETALLWSRATADDVTRNRVSNTLMVEALSDPTPAAYNPFSGGVNSNIERALVDVYRHSETELRLIDLKLSNPALFGMPAGDAAFLAGVEFREEKFKDDRDPRLDGRIVFTDFQGDTYPFVSDVVNSSPTPSSRGSRNVTSVFTELHLPLLENLDAQVALRYEDFSDVGNTTVPKIALGWQVFEPLLLRASWSEAFRAPNLVTINEEIVARNNTRTDYACEYAADFGGDPMQDELDCRYPLQRIAQGSEQLEPEESTNWSAGMVIEPLEGLMITFDYWSIEKEDTIGLFGEENHTLLDLLYRLEAGTSNCASFEGNPAVDREPADPDLDTYYLAAGICPAGDVSAIDDRYANLDKRKVEGYDVGIYWDFETPIGDFSTRFVGSFLETFDQEPGGLALELLEAQSNGTLPSEYPVSGFADLIRIDGNQEERINLSVAYNRGDFGSSITAYYVGDFIQDSLTIEDPDDPEQDLLYEVDSMTTYNFRADYTWNVADRYDLRTRIGVNNFTDERAPLADRYFGYFSDSHRDLGRFYYVDVRLTF